VLFIAELINMKLNEVVKAKMSVNVVKNTLVHYIISSASAIKVVKVIYFKLRKSTFEYSKDHKHLVNLKNINVCSLLPTKKII